MKLFIEKLFSKTINTIHGPKQQVSVLHKGTWYSAFANEETSGWKEGITIEVEVNDKQGKDGKTYHNRMFPKRAGGYQNLDSISSQQQQIMHELLEIKAAVQLLVKHFTKAIGTDEPPPYTDDDVPSDTEETPF